MNYPHITFYGSQNQVSDSSYYAPMHQTTQLFVNIHQYGQSVPYNQGQPMPYIPPYQSQVEHSYSHLSASNTQLPEPQHSLINSLSQQDQIMQSLIHFVTTGNLEALKKKDPDLNYINVKDSYGRTLAHWAASAGALNILVYLSKNGADMAARDWERNTPLHILAVSQVDNSFVKELNYSGINYPNDRAETPLHLAVMRKKYSLVTEFIKQGADGSFPYNGKSIGHIATKNKDLQMLKILHAHGVNLQLIDANGLTPFQCAVKYNFRDIVDWFLKCGLHQANNKVFRSESNSKERENVAILPTSAELLRAIQSDDVSFFERIIKQRKLQELQKICVDGENAFQLSMRLGKNAIVDLFIEQEMDFTVVDGNQRTLAHIAAKHGFLDVLRILYLNELNLDLPDVDGNTPLHLAAGKGHIPIVKFFIEYKSKINAQTKGLWTPLHSAASEGHEKVVEMLLDAKADVSLKTAIGNTAFDSAVMGGHRSLLKLLRCRAVALNPKPVNAKLVNVHPRFGLDEQAPKIKEEQDDFVPQPPLIEVVIEEDYRPREEGVEDDMQPGVEVDMQPGVRDEMQPGFVNEIPGANAPVNNMPAPILPKGTKVDISKVRKAIKARYTEQLIKLAQGDYRFDIADTKGRTPLHWAVQENNLTTLKWLVERGLELDSKDLEGNTPAHMAAHYGFCAPLQLLLSLGVNMSTFNGQGLNTLHIAAMRAQKAAVEILVPVVAVNAPSQEGGTALYYAAIASATEVVRLLLQSGADHKKINAEGETLAHVALRYNSLPVLEIAAKQRGGLDSLDVEGRSLMHLAARDDKMAMVKFLTTHCDSYKRDKHQKTPAHYAAEHGCYKILQFLLSSGRDIDARDGEGRTVLQIVHDKGDTGIALWLIQMGADLDGIDLSALIEKQSYSQGDRKILSYSAMLELAEKNGKLNGSRAKSHQIQQQEKDKEDKSASKKVKHSNKTARPKKDKRTRRELSEEARVAAVEGDIKKIVELAKQQGLRGVDKEGFSVVHWAAIGGKVEVLLCLFNNRINLSRENDHGENIGHIAARRGDIKLLEFYLTLNTANIEARDNFGNTLLLMAARHGQKQMMRYLQGKGADISAKDKRGMTSVELLQEHKKKRS